MIQLPSKKESTMITDYILLPLILTVFERDMNEIKQSNIKTKEPYIGLLIQAMDLVTKDMSKIKQEFKKSGIKVYEEIRDQQGIGCRYLCRGYHHNFYMLWGLVKAKVKVRMEKYLGVE